MNTKTPWSMRLLILLLLILVAISGYNYFVQPFSQIFQPTPPTTEAPINEPITDETAFAAKSDTRSKVSLLVAAPITVNEIELVATRSSFLQEIESVIPANDAKVAQVNEANYGFVTLFGESLTSLQVQEFIQKITEKDDRLGSPMIMVDHEGGNVQRLRGEGFDELPAWNTLCAEDRSNRLQKLQSSARQLARAGIDIVLAPTIDISDNNTVLGTRICSGDPLTVLTGALDYISTFSGQGILPVVKHFPGIGDTKKDLHVAADQVTVNDDSVYLYRYILNQFPNLGVMVSHVGVTNQDPLLPCSLSAFCVGELKTEYPSVLVVSDALEMESALEYVRKNLESREASGSSSVLPEASGSAVVSQMVSTQSARLTPITRDEALAAASVRAVKSGVEVLVFGEGVRAEELMTVISALEREYMADPSFAVTVDAAINKILLLKQNRLQHEYN